MRAPFATAGHGSVVVAGEGALTFAVVRDLEDAAIATVLLEHPGDLEFERAMDAGPEAVAIVTRDDAYALRLALLAAHACPSARLVVTIFDRTVAQQLRSAIDSCIVVSMADLVAAPFAGACMGDEVLALREHEGDAMQRIVRDGEDCRLEPQPRSHASPARRLAHVAMGVLHPFERSAKTLMLGLFGLLAVLLVDTLLSLTALHNSLVDAWYSGVRTLVTVGANPSLDHAAGWTRVVAAILMLAALAFTAIFTAGLINRLLDRRLITIVGPRVMPRHDHVVVVGLGQVGLRLCVRLRETGLAVAAVERNADGVGVRLAPSYDVPVVVGEGSDRKLLTRLSLHRAHSLAAVTSDDLTNVAICMAALAVAPQLRVVLRAGDGDIAAETRSLFRIGVVRDAHRIAGAGIAAAALGWTPGDVLAEDGQTYLWDGAGGMRAFPAPHARAS
ncbi:MAG TPA: NAD-binding protein [Solirubrobacteraceae bacterium]